MNPFLVIFIYLLLCSFRLYRNLNSTKPGFLLLGYKFRIQSIMAMTSDIIGLFLTCLLLGAQGGILVLSHQQISDTAGSFTGAISSTEFGSSPSSLGDVDGDDVTDIAVGNHFKRAPIIINL